jgi:hypothetical protein
MRFALGSSALVGSFALGLGACTSSTTGHAAVLTGTGSDSGASYFDTDAGPLPPFTGEAPHTPLPQLVDQGGPVLTAPQIVTITFPGDPQAAILQPFGETLTQSSWWDAVRAGFCETGSTTSCVGDGPAGTSVVLTTAPALSYTDSSLGGASTLQTYITSLLASGAVPPPTDQSILVFYFPSTTSIAFGGDSSCVDFGGYHNSMTYQGTTFTYAIVPECTAQTGRNLTTVQSITFSASHEVLEAATDPIVTGATAGFYLNFSDPTILPWNNFLGGEAGDLCVDDVLLSQDETTEGGYTVQRIWSNAQAAAGHDPCIPNPGTIPYFNVAPEYDAQIVEMNVGETTTIVADAFSDGAISDWYLDALDLDGTAGNPSPYLTLKVNGAPATRTNNGAKVTISITLNQDPSALLAEGRFGATAILRSVNSLSPTTNPPTAGHLWPFVVTTPADALDAGLGGDVN